jgi:hypothetical protein
MKAHLIHSFLRWFGRGSFVSTAALICTLAATGAAKADTCGSVAGNAVLNCGFETGDFAGWNLSGNLEGGAPPNTYYGVDSTNPNSGTYAAYIGVQGGGGSAIGSLGPFLNLAQTLKLLPSEYYQVTFYLDQNAPSPAPGYLNYFDARFNGAYLFNQVNVPNSGGAYQLYTLKVSTPLSVTAANASLLEFNFQNDSDYFFLDDVSVTPLGPTPEPASWLLIPPIVGVLCIMQRRRRSS